MAGELDFYKLEAKYIVDGGTRATERELTKWVRDLAVACGWMEYHHPDSRRAQTAGLPDLILLNPPLLLFVELKKLGRSGMLRPEQRTWIEALRTCGQRAEVWTPNEIPEIWTMLTGLPW